MIVVMRVLVASIAIQSNAQIADLATERLRTLVAQGWWRRTESEVRAIWKEDLRVFTCVAGTDRCRGLATQRRGCGDDEFVFEGSQAATGVFLHHFEITVCVDDRADADRLLRSWLTVLGPPASADRDAAVIPGEIERRFRWVDGKEAIAVELGLHAKPEAGVWVVRLNLSGFWR